MADPLAWIADELQALESAGLLRGRRTVVPLPDGWCEVDGQRLLNFAANDYLGLAGDGRVIAAARQAADEAGCGARASALVTGRTPWHERLEQHLAAFEGTEAAVLFPTGYAANVGTVAALVGEGDVVFSDRLNHASLVDGCRLSGARFRVYPHNDVAALQHALDNSAGFRRRLIVTDGRFSMDGDLAPLPQLLAVANSYGGALLVDEAHATGIFGALGRGACELCGVEGPGVVRVGTLSKGIGVQGGFVAGPRLLIDWLWNRARTQMFSTALTPAACAAAAAALDIIRDEPERRQRLLSRAAGLRQRLVEAGLTVPPGCCGPIIPVLIGDAAAAVEASRRLQARGFLVPAIRPPTVPRNTARLRISLSALHDEASLKALADVMASEAARIRG